MKTLETVGRKYERVRYEVHSRKSDSDESAWYGMSKYATPEEAQNSIAQNSKRYVKCGGITLDTGTQDNLFEYRIVKVISQCEVIHVENRLV